MANIILDFSIKKALEQRAQLKPNHELILPWWFKREVSVPRSHEVYKAFVYVMRWLDENAPEEAEHIYCEADDSQNIVINPMYIIGKEILVAFKDAGFHLVTDDEMPKKEKDDMTERLMHGSNFNVKWE